jgi:hypothetical protein
MAGIVIHDNIFRDFEYALITAYLPKGICIVGLQLGLIPDLNISHFNLGYRKNYMLLAPNRYLTKMTRKQSKIVPQPWIKGITRSTILNMMNIPHFERHQEVNVCVKPL